eukprot:1237922-Alexandrium_andersonii.AAC.2
MDEFMMGLSQIDAVEAVAADVGEDVEEPEEEEESQAVEHLGRQAKTKVCSACDERRTSDAWGRDRFKGP